MTTRTPTLRIAASPRSGSAQRDRAQTINRAQGASTGRASQAGGCRRPALEGMKK
jgi:hypothetical protein